MMQRFLTVCLLAAGLPCVAQEELRGVVIDAQTREPIVGAHVIGIGTRIVGNSTNTEGAFSLSWQGTLDSVRVSCIGYTTTRIAASSLRSPVTIPLAPYTTSLHALTVRPPSPTQLIRNAVRAIPKNYSVPPFQLRGFYREVIHRDTAYYSVAEAVFESQLKEDDEAMLKLVQGRRSESVQSTRMFEDYHPGGGPNFLMNRLLEAGVPEFMQEKNFDDYQYSLDSITSYDGQDVYVVGFDQRDDLKKNSWRGKIFIEAEGLAIIEVIYSLSDKGVDYRKHLSGTDQVMANLLGIDYTILDRTIRCSYRKEGARWQLHDASLRTNIHFIQPRKKIDEHFTLQAQLLALRQQDGPLVPFDRNEVWRRNQLVKNLPGEFDERFWGAENFIKPEVSLTEAVAAMDVLRSSTLPAGAPEGWTLFRGQDANIYQRGSTILMKPYVTSRWKDAEQGPFLWQTVSGDMELQARIRVTKSMDTTRGPDAGFQLGGIMLRPEGVDPENHILLGVACMGNPQLKMVSQNTVRGNSAIHVTRVEQNEFVFRLRRKGPQVELHYQEPGTDSWTLLRQYQRPEWPAELQAGIAGYAYVPGTGPNRKPDLLIRADLIHIKKLDP